MKLGDIFKLRHSLLRELDAASWVGTMGMPITMLLH